ncbi:MAG: hypothetical protein JW763_04490 [candidate division Zixibacteria bacterium]|nr:hypothetical protein [candidate division Zixibacteria bacterium]
MIKQGIWVVVAVLWAALSFADATDSASCGVVIDSVIIDNRNIYDLDDPQYDHWIFRLANAFNIKTKKWVIHQELLLDKGDVYSEVLAEETAHNLRSLPYIWNAGVCLRQVDSATILQVTTSDRWSLVGGPSVNRSAGETTYQLGFEETNFLGYGHFVGVNVFVRDFDDDFYSLAYVYPRLFGGGLTFDGYRNTAPGIGISWLQVSLPWLSLSQRYSFLTAYEHTDRRNDYYRDGVIVAQDEVRGDDFVGKVSQRLGGYHYKFLTALYYKYMDVRSCNRRQYADDVSVTFSSDSLYHFAEGQVGVEHIQYIKTRRINMFSRDEDVDLVTGVYLKLGRAWNAGSGAKLYDKFTLEAHLDRYWRRHLLLIDYERNEWYNGEVSFRKRQDVSIRYYYNGLKWLTPLVSIQHTRDIRLDRMRFLYLGGNEGIRGYPRNYCNGEKRLLINVEPRFFPGIRVMAHEVGAAMFVDLGQCWNHGETLEMSDLNWTIGAGIRIGAERIAQEEVLRIDLAYAGRSKTWEISFGMGQFIN